VSAVRWVGELRDEGDVRFRIGRDGAELVAEWIGLCELRCDREGRDPRFTARPGADAQVVAKVRRGLSAALVRHLQGGTTLHASCVARPSERALAFLGASGSGKSTLAAFLCATRGFALLADDVVRVDVETRPATAHPTEADHWLGTASRRALEAGPRAATGATSAEAMDATDEKLPRAAPRVASAEAPLAALFAVSLDATLGAPAVTPCRGQRAIELLVPALVRFVIDEPGEHMAELDRMSRLVASVPMYELRCPRAFDALDATAELVERVRAEQEPSER